MHESKSENAKLCKTLINQRYPPLLSNRLGYNNGSYEDPPNVRVFTPNFGSLDSLVDLSDFFPDTTDEDITKYFVERGYILDVNVKAASYDWRLGAGEVNTSVADTTLTVT